MKKVILESPFAGEVEKNIAYARMCVRDSLLRGESPIASHLLYTQDGILDDHIPEQRKLGIDAGLIWRDSAELHVFYVDFGMSKGMQYAYDTLPKGANHVFRHLGDTTKDLQEFYSAIQADDKMKPEKALKILKHYNNWRLGLAKELFVTPKELTKAIKNIIKQLEK